MCHLRKSLLVLAAFMVLLSQGCASKPSKSVPSQSIELPSATQPEIAPSQGSVAPPTTSQGFDATAVPVEANQQVAQTVNAVAGGEISLTTSSGDLIQLFLPPFALPENTEVSLIAHSNPLDSPFKQNFFPGISILPDGLSLRLPATLTLTPASHMYAPGERIFYLKSSEMAIPLWQSEQGGTSLSGKVNHFSDYIGGSPTGDEARSQAAASSSLGGNLPDGMDDSLEGNQAMSEWGDTLNDMGLDADGQSLLDQANQRLAENIACLLDPTCYPQPEDPCGDYQRIVMMAYQQAVLQGFDAESQAMQSLYSLLENVLNKCTNRYTLQYSHNLSYNQGSIQQEIITTGEVVFYAPMYGVGELGEPLTMEGSGTIDVTITGQITSDDETCPLSGSGTTNVSISGELQADEMGNPWIVLQVDEQWYTSGELTVSCPDDDPQTGPIPGLPNQTVELRFPYEDGAQITKSNVGGLEGEYIWTLRILHSW